MARTQTKKRKTRKRKRLSSQEKAQRARERNFAKERRQFLRNLGFEKIPADGKEIQVSGRTGELDDIFLLENLILLVEYTTGTEGSSHVLKKKPLYDNI